MAIVLRQEIYVANMTKRPVELSGLDCGIEDSLDPAHNVVWPCRIMSHAARATNFAYSSETRTPELWDQLWEYLEEWDRAKPASFEPLNQTCRDGPSDDDTNGDRGAPKFPEVYYVSGCAIASRQYMELCRIILLAHDPRAPSLGIGRMSYMRTQEHQVREAVRVICGIWLSNQGFVPARVTAGLVIGMTGELFTDPLETRRLFEILVEAENHVGWQRIKASPFLRDFWAISPYI